MLNYSDYKILKMKPGDVVFWDTLNKRYEIELNDETNQRHGIYMGMIPAGIHPLDAQPFLKEHAIRRLRMSIYSKDDGVSPQDRALIKVSRFSHDGKELKPYFYAAIPCTIFRVIDYETGETRSQERMHERTLRRHNEKTDKAKKRKKQQERRSKIPLEKIGLASDLC